MEHGGFPVSSSFVPSRSSSYFRAIVNQPEGGGYGERGRCLSKPEVVRNPRILARGGFYGAPDATCAAHICIPSSPRTRESPSAEFPRLPSSLSLSLSIAFCRHAVHDFPFRQGSNRVARLDPRELLLLLLLLFLDCLSNGG